MALYWKGLPIPAVDCPETRCQSSFCHIHVYTNTRTHPTYTHTIARQGHQEIFYTRVLAEEIILPVVDCITSLQTHWHEGLLLDFKVYYTQTVHQVGLPIHSVWHATSLKIGQINETPRFGSLCQFCITYQFGSVVLSEVECSYVCISHNCFEI